MSDLDKGYMTEALRLAEEGLGRVAPNPSVGCIIVKDGEIVGRARTADGGRPHAEPQALQQAGDKAKGATVYVTLEPCCHHGRTLPCTDELIAAQVSRVVIACLDKDRRVAGQGVQALKDAKIEVLVGVLEDEALEINDGFFKRVTNYRPLITLKTAVSIDSKIASAAGESQWITGAESRQRVHQERARHDAILTGIGTILKDDPLLTTRIEGVEHKSLRVILDSQLRFPLTAKMTVTTFEGPIIIYTAPGADVEKKAALEKAGIRVVEIDLSSNGKLSLPFIMEHLANEGITRLLVEAGQGVFTAFMKLKLWDHLLVFRSPIVIGNKGMDAFGEMEDNLAQAQRLQLVSLEPYGNDLLELYKKAE